jgi:hypothetical protein
MNIFGFQLAVKKFVKWNTINFLNYALILRRSVVNFFKNLVLCPTSFTQKPCSTENLLTAISIRTSKIVT